MMGEVDVFSFLQKSHLTLYSLFTLLFVALCKVPDKLKRVSTQELQVFKMSPFNWWPVYNTGLYDSCCTNQAQLALIVPVNQVTEQEMKKYQNPHTVPGLFLDPTV